MTQAKIAMSRQDIRALLDTTPAPPTLVPDLMAIARDPLAHREGPGAQLVLGITEPFLVDLDDIPRLTYYLYREFRRSGERNSYQNPLRATRSLLSALALRVLLGHDEYLDRLQDVIWAICEETNWVMPAHENREIDLGSVGTAFALAEIIVGLEEKLAGEVVDRVRAEIEGRIMEPYIERHDQLNWYRGRNNWNGVCNSGCAATFLLLEPDTSRQAHALSIALDGLEHFLAVAFEEEGSSNEGVSYWNYGLSNLIPFSEMLRLRTTGAIDILGLERLRQIASYPNKLMISAGRYANFSDCEEVVAANPSNISRLAERTETPALYETLAQGAELVRETNYGRFHNLWRIINWWDGRRPGRPTIADTYAADMGAAKVVQELADGTTLVLAAKAGHNNENHNQNDVGTFVLHADGESLLCDPGRGLYSRQYFGPERYENVFANSSGHSVPAVDGQLQSPGREHAGQVLAVETDGPAKAIRMEIGGAYEVERLEGIERSLSISAEGEFVLEDRFRVTGEMPVEEALITWFEVSASGSTARIAGERHALELTIESPAGTEFGLEVLEDESKANAKDVPLRRLSVETVAEDKLAVRIRGRIVPS